MWPILISALFNTSYFYAESPYKPRHNGLFEGLARNYDNTGFWMGTELPLETDGPEPTTKEAYSPVRITYYDWNSETPKFQFIYPLDKIEKAPKGDFAVNGLSDLFTIGNKKFLMLERSYSSGWGKKANGLKIYEVDASNSENTLETQHLSESKIKPVSKKLAFNLESIRKGLQKNTIDNIEKLYLDHQLLFLSCFEFWIFFINYINSPSSSYKFRVEVPIF